MSRRDRYICFPTPPTGLLVEVWNLTFSKSSGCMHSTAAVPAPIPATAWSCCKQSSQLVSWILSKDEWRTIAAVGKKLGAGFERTSCFTDIPSNLCYSGKCEQERAWAPQARRRWRYILRFYNFYLCNVIGWPNISLNSGKYGTIFLHFMQLDLYPPPPCSESTKGSVYSVPQSRSFQGSRTQTLELALDFTQQSYLHDALGVLDDHPHAPILYILGLIW